MYSLFTLFVILLHERSNKDVYFCFSSQAADPSSLIRCTINRSNPSRYEDYDMMDVDSPPPTRQNNNFRVTTRNEYVQYGQVNILLILLLHFFLKIYFILIWKLLYSTTSIN